MTYIKLLTVLAGLALLTACGGAATPANTGGDTTTDCKTNAFHADCNADTTAISSRQIQCLDDADIHSTCDEVIVGVCMANPFQTDACLPDDTYLPDRIAECITGGMGDTPNCRLITTDATKNAALTSCLTNPFAEVCETSVPDFTSSFEQARTNRLTFCDDSANATDDLCMDDNVRPICRFDSFNAICFTGDTYLSDRVADCIKTENTEAEKCNTLLSNTAMNTTITNCLTNPFTDTCASNADFMTHATTAQMNRASFCDMAGNGTKALCTGDNVMGVCDIDSFNAICFTDKTYLPMRLGECIKTENAEDMRCNTLLSDATMNTAITACLTNPFSDTCEADSDFMTHAETAQTNRVSFCGMMGNDTKALCMGENVMGVCGIDPFNAICINNTAYLTNRQMRCVTDAIPHTSCGTVLGSIVDPTDITDITTPAGVLNHADLPATAALAFANTNSTAHFVGVGADGIDTTRLATSRSNSAEPTPVTLSRAGDAMDGVTYVRGLAKGSDQSFVGLLPTTNLGAPLPIGMGQPTDAEWTGRYFNRLIVGTATHHPITFDINFAEGTITTDPDTQGAVSTTFNLGFTAEGVITGTVDATNSASTLSDTAPVRGLIGEQGLVGGFANTDGGVLGSAVFYGGFVAEPSVATRANFKTYYAARTDNRRLHPDLTTGGQAAFVEGTPTSLPIDGLTFTGDGQFAPVAIRLKKAATGDDGFALMFGEVTGTGLTRRFRAGLLSGTDLGPAVPTTSTATWAGSLHLAVGTSGVNNVDLPTVSVDFANGTITAPETEVGTGSKVTINGRFGAGLPSGTPAGILGGTVNFDFGGNNQFLNQPLIGLIGTKGVIGVFHGPDNLAAAGGFQASPSE